jgi:hypothetical protein
MSEFGIDPSDRSTQERRVLTPESEQFDETDPRDTGMYLRSLAFRVEDDSASVRLTQDGVEEANYPDGEDDDLPEEHYNHPGHLAD